MYISDLWDPRGSSALESAVDLPRGRRDVGERLQGSRSGN